MPFFQATSTKLPLTHEVLGAYPSAGRYSYTENQINVTTSIRRNPYWARGPGRAAPGRLEGLDILWNQNEGTLFDGVKAGTFDEDPVVPPAEKQGLAEQYGVNKSRFWVKPQACLTLVVFNNENRLFKNNPQLRKAVNYAIDRTDYVATLGPFAARPWSRLIPPGVPGTGSKQPYPAHANLAKARKLARGHFHGGKITVYYRASGTGPAQGQVVHDALVRLGFKPDEITMKGFTGGDIYTAMGVHGSDGDIGVSWGLCGDYPSGFGGPDPATFLGYFLEPAPWAEVLGVHIQAYRARFDAANRLHGAARLRALGRLDLDLMRNVAPAAPLGIRNNSYFFSDRVDPSSLKYEPMAADWSIADLALK
jgi:ABC-type transport system substrate-binding protein